MPTCWIGPSVCSILSCRFCRRDLAASAARAGETISLAEWPKYDPAFEAPDAVKEMELLMEAIRSVRNVRAEVNVARAKDRAAHQACGRSGA
uniref:class I tRNA ligase family protein n=1 Tax=Cohnella faecalis TaxID=2315694 RepID=UPI0039896A14